MEIKNLFDQQVKDEIIVRFNKLSAASKALWGTMSVEKMLKHLQLPLLVPYGRHTPRGSFLIRLLGPLMKRVLYNEKPYKQGLPTDKTYIITDEKEFEHERKELIELIKEFTPESIRKEVHPIFGMMTKEQWSKATWKHLDHHLRQFGV